MAPPSDCELLQLVEDGSEFALIALYDRYASLVYSVAFRVLRDRASAEDVSQEIFMRLWERPQQIQVVGSTLHGWMTIASRNRSIDQLRRRTLEPLDTTALPSPSHLADEAERRLMSDKILRSASRGQRILLEMAYFDDMSHAEIASATGLPLGTIKTKIRRALRALRETVAVA
jgi:RNA polymerase sigma-70 factor, ECF subfamily